MNEEGERRDDESRAHLRNQTGAMEKNKKEEWGRET